MAITRPWGRFTGEQAATLPKKLTADVIDGLDDDTFTLLLMVYLTPTYDRGAWGALWRILAEHDDLGNRAWDLLTEWADLAEQRKTEDPDDVERRRISKFLNNVEGSFNRLDRPVRDKPLAWAGENGKFDPKAAAVIARLVGAVARHRTATLSAVEPTDADKALWGCLAAVNLDPNDYPHQD